MVADLHPSAISGKQDGHPFFGLIPLLIGMLDDHETSGPQQVRGRVDPASDDIHAIGSAVESDGRIKVPHFGVTDTCTLGDVGRIHRYHRDVSDQSRERAPLSRARAGIRLHDLHMTSHLGQGR